LDWEIDFDHDRCFHYWSFRVFTDLCEPPDGITLLVSNDDSCRACNKRSERIDSRALPNKHEVWNCLALTTDIFQIELIFCRAMAVCFSMMVGRIGSVVGSLVIGTVINNYCKETFLMPTILLLTSGVLAFTIPNISKRIK
jgi:hypothetical protein